MIADTQITDLATAKELGLSQEEFDFVCRKLERKPNYAELGIFSAMFSEHCSYKSSKPYLKKFPTKGPRVLQGPGENAGILDLGEGWAVAFKMESHNHPSFIEPYQGAATGVGGILRDVFTMGARPIASMNSLCFGSENNPITPGIVRGVVKGIGDYGNSIGVPTVAGQTLFHPCYDGNPLVNAFTAGIVRHDAIFRASASGIGNVLVYAGAKTGRDGVHGATMASQEFSTEKEPERPTVQVGDPFTEKLLLEATLEAMQKGLILSIQDMGAAGLTSSSFEMAGRAQSGLRVDLDKIPTRESGMSAYELLLSESQERMLIVTQKEKLEGLKATFDKWDLHAEQIGEIIEGRKVLMMKDGVQVVDLPVDLVTEPILADRPVRKPNNLEQLWFIDKNKLIQAPTKDKLAALLENFSFADPQPLVVQYDSMVGNRTEGGTFDDAAVLRLREVKDKTIRLAFSTDCNARVCYLDPKEGGRRAIAECALNLATRGATPLGVTDCLNFGSPENPEVMWQFSESCEGISEACELLKTPVVSGNVSFYNDTDGQPIYPTPMIGMVGLIEGKQPLPESYFFDANLELALLGPIEGDLGGSLMASQWFKRECGKPANTDLPSVGRMIKCLGDLRKASLHFAAHDISDGGLALASLEMAFRSPVDEIGVEISIPPRVQPDEVLFGESLPRILIAFDPELRSEMESIAAKNAIKFHLIGKTNHSGDLDILQGMENLTSQAIAPLKTNWSQKWGALFN